MKKEVRGVGKGKGQYESGERYESRKRYTERGDGRSSKGRKRYGKRGKYEEGSRMYERRRKRRG